MSEVKDAYYLRPEISNSDLSWLKRYWEPQQYVVDLEKAFKDGTLIDMMITEPNRVNYFKRTAGDYSYTPEEFANAEEMKKAFYRDAFCSSFVKQCLLQKSTVVPKFEITLPTGFTFNLEARCRWDFYGRNTDIGGDLKSTACTTQKQFEEAVRHFDYDRSRSWYMDLSGRNNDIIIGISKVNHKIFKVPIRRGDSIYKDGLKKYQELAFRFWCLFGERKS